MMMRGVCRVDRRVDVLYLPRRYQYGQYSSMHISVVSVSYICDLLLLFCIICGLLFLYHLNYI